MKATLRILAGLAAVIFVAQAHAGFMIEPFLGYEMGTAKGTSSSHDLKGLSYGARLGYSVTMFSFGAEYGGGKLELDTNPTDHLANTDLGAFVAVDFPVMIRAFATYMLKAEAKEDDGTKLTGKGFRIGVGYTGFPFISINLEHISKTYDEADGHALSADFKTDTNMLSVSVPLP
jgi:hypothetical protein